MSARIVKKVAKHYGKRPCIVGWQIDNELNCEVDEFYSESDTLAFREFLKKKYKTLDALNEAWNYCMEPDLHELERNLCATDNGA